MQTNYNGGVLATINFGPLLTTNINWLSCLDQLKQFNNPALLAKCHLVGIAEAKSYGKRIIQEAQMPATEQEFIR